MNMPESVGTVGAGYVEVSGKPQKGIFISLLLITCVILVALAFVLWWIPYVGLANIHPNFPLILAVFFGCVVLFALGGALTLVFTIIRGKNLFF